MGKPEEDGKMEEDDEADMRKKTGDSKEQHHQGHAEIGGYQEWE